MISFGQNLLLNANCLTCMSANVAYGQVKYAPNTYEELDRLAAAASGGGAPVYATADQMRQQPHPQEDKGHYDI